MRVLVTGTAGHIDGNLVRALLEESRPVCLFLDRDNRALESLDVEVLHGDLLGPSSLRLAVDGVESIFHAAASVGVEGANPEATERTIVGGTRDTRCHTSMRRFEAREAIRFSHGIHTSMRRFEARETIRFSHGTNFGYEPLFRSNFDPKDGD